MRGSGHTYTHTYMFSHVCTQRGSHTHRHAPTHAGRHTHTSTSWGSPEEEGEDHLPQWIFLNFYKVILFRYNYTNYIHMSPNKWLKHTVSQWRSTAASTALSRVAPWCSRRTVSFRPPRGTLTSIQNLGGSWFSLPSIDLHRNYDNFQRTSYNLSEFLQHELRCG